MNIRFATEDLVKPDFKDQIMALEAMIATQGGFSLEKIRTLNNESGQSAIEFILTFAVGLGIVFLVSIQGLNVTKGYFAQYVNFMVSRTYLVDDRGVNVEQTMLRQAEQRALQVGERYDLRAVGIDAQINIISPTDGRGLYAGSVIEFSEPISALPIIGGSSEVNLYGESFLGREPFRITCYQQTCLAMTGSGAICQNSGDNLDMVVYDNGC